MEKSVIKLLRYTISAFIIFATLQVNGAYTTPGQRMPYGSLDSILVKLEGDDTDIATAKTTIQREAAINKFAKKAEILIGKYTIGTTVIISDVKMKDKNTATISFNKIETPMFDKIKNIAPFSLLPTKSINIPLKENTARDIVPGQRLTLLGEASFAHYNDSLMFHGDQNAYIRLLYKNYSGGSIIIFTPTAYKIEKSAPKQKYVQRTTTYSTTYKPRYIQPKKQVQTKKPTQGKIKASKQPVKSKPILKTYTDEYISFNYPSSWKVMTMHTNNFSKVTCTGGKEIFSVTYCYSKFDPIDTINAWVNKCHIPEISRQAVHTSKVSGSSVNTCYYYTKVNKFVHTGCVKVFNTSTGNTVIIHEQAESKDDMTSPTGALCNIEKSFKLVSVNQQK